MTTTPPPAPGDSAFPTRWLAYRLGHLGDVVLMTGVLAYFARTRGWRFAVATREAFAPVFGNMPHIEQCFALRQSDLTLTAFIARSRRMAKALPGWGLLDLHASTRSRVLGLLWPGPVVRYPKMGLERRVFLASGRKLFKQPLNALSVPQRYALAFAGEAPPASELVPRIALSDGETTEAGARLAELFGQDIPSAPAVKPVALHPYATHALKAWPEGHWRRLAALLDTAGLPWVSIGVGKPLFPDRKEDLTGITDLRQSCALIARCRALVTGDSGPMHLASAVGTRVIALFGPTTKEWGFYPSGPADSVLELPLPCRPCSLHGKRPCPRSGECLALISPETAFSAIVSSTARV